MRTTLAALAIALTLPAGALATRPKLPPPPPTPPVVVAPAPEPVVVLPPSAPPVTPPVVLPELPSVAITPVDGSAAKPPALPPATLLPSVSYRVVVVRCRITQTRPRNAVGPRQTPRLGQVRAKRGTDGRWATYRDRFRITRREGQPVRVEFTPGPFCGVTRTLAVLA